MKCVFVIDDATLGVQGQRDQETPGGVSPIAECMFMGQKYGLGVIIIAHSASSLSAVIRQNTRAWLVTGLPGEDLWLIRNLLGVSPEQAETVRASLKRGQFICFNPVLLDKAVLAEFPQVPVPGVCDEPMRRDLLQKFLATVTTKPPAPLDVFRSKPVPSTAGQEKTVTGKELPQEQIEMLVIIASGVPKTAGKVYEALGTGRSQGVRIARAIEAVGAIAAHRFSTGRVGGQICFFEVLAYGWTVLQARGISRPTPLTNGGFEHELAAWLLKAEAIRNNFGIQFEVDLGGLRADALMINKKTGQRICCQIGVSKPDHEVDSIQKFFGLPASQNAKFVLIARDVTFVKEVKKVFKARRIADAIVKQVNIRVIADLIKE
jgi:hypothetical protein